MERTILAIILAPTLGGFVWWLIWIPAHWVRMELFRKIPDSSFKRFLFCEREGNWLTIKPPSSPFSDEVHSHSRAIRKELLEVVPSKDRQRGFP